MPFNIKKTYVIFLFLIFPGCLGLQNAGDNTRKTGHNMIFTGFDAGISNPENDRRSYYRIYIDKVESGRTTIGLESQEKTFSIRLDSNRHLISVEKWVLDRRQGKYIKLNNINQPRPNYLYFTVPEKGTINVIMKTERGNRSEFLVKIK